MERRVFLQSLGALLGLPWEAIAHWERPRPAPLDLGSEEDFWAWVRTEFPLHPSLINLNNGGVSPHPRPVLEALFRHELQANQAPAYSMWRLLDQKELFGNVWRRFVGQMPKR